MGVPRVLANLSNTKMGQNIYTKLLHPNKERLLNEGLPLVSSGVCTLSYCWATEHDKHIPRQQKGLLQVQNIVNGAVGILLSAKLSKYAYNKTEQVIKKLNPKLIKDCDTVINGARIAVPIAITSVVMRLLVSSGSVLVSDWYKRLQKKKSLDVKV